MDVDPSTPTARDFAAPPPPTTPPPAHTDRTTNPPTADSHPNTYSNTSQSRLLSLPPELLLDIAKHLSLGALFRLHLSCRRLHTLLLRFLTAAFSEHLDYILLWSIDHNAPHLFTRALADGASFSPTDMTRIITGDHGTLLPALFAARPSYLKTINTAWRHQPLHDAATHNAESCLLALLHAGVLPDMRDASGSTGLHHAATHNAESCLLALLHAGALPDIRDASGSTALHHATWANAESCVLALLAAGALPDILDADGSTPLHNAAWRNTTASCVQALLRAGALPDRRDGDGYTPLHLAAGHKMESCVRTLLGAGARPDLPDPDGYMALYYAFHASSEGVARALIASGAGRMIAPPAAVGKAGLREESWDGDAVMYAVSHNPRMLAVVAEAGWVGPRVPGGVTPLQKAVRGGELHVVRALLEAGADVDALGDAGWSTGWTPLHECVWMYGREHLMDLLVEKGAKLDIVGGARVGANRLSIVGGEKGFTPLELAKQLRNQEAMAKLETYAVRE